MPEMDGYELTTRIRADEGESGAHLPIVALTGDALAGAAQYCLDIGMDDYLSKPVAIDLLDTTVQRWLPAAAALRRPAAGGAAKMLPSMPSPVPEGDADGPPVVDPACLIEAFGGFYR